MNQKLSFLAQICKKIISISIFFFFLSSNIFIYATRNIKIEYCATISSNNQKEHKKYVKIDLFAPFKTEGYDICCRAKLPDCEKALPGDGCYQYKDYHPEDKGSSGTCTFAGAKSDLPQQGQIVQRIITKAAEEKKEQVMIIDIFDKYIGFVFVYGLGIGAAFSVLMIVIGGIQTIVTGSSPESVSAGKERILRGVAGIGLLLLSASILYTINPLFFTL